MKHNSILLVLFLLFAGTATAQHVNIGIKGGLNIYKFDGASVFESKAGINLGVLGHIHLSDQLALQPEVYYSGQGTKLMNTDNAYHLNYINVPVLLQYMFNNGFRIQAGPQIGFLAGANIKTGSNTNSVSDDFKTIDFGLGIGGSYVHPPTGLGLDLRYNHGLSRIYNSPNDNWKNRGFQIGLFYLFNHKS